MGGKHGRHIPARLEETRRRFDSWRGSRERRGRIPVVLWEAAVALARKHGVHRTARELHLNYGALEKRTKVGRYDTAKPVATFVEVPGAGAFSCRGCVIEVEAPNGAKLRVELHDAAASDVAGLVRSLWSTAE